MFEDVIRAVEAFDTVIIHRHTSPDGDALGCQIGLKNLIKDNYPQKNVYAVGDGAGRYSFMDGSTMDEVNDEMYQNALAFVLDSGSSHLVSDERYKQAKKTVRLDHHLFQEQFADIEVVDTSYESCCGLVTELALEANWKFSPASAKALYTGMVTDSGRFRYDSTSSNTFRLASALLREKFDMTGVYTNLYSDDFEKIRLRAQFVLKICFTPYQVAYIYTPREEFESYGVDAFTISRGMVNTMSEIKGVNTWVNFTETKDGVLVEIRSSEHNINPIAVKYGGGGHMKASGACVKDKATAMALLDDLNALNMPKNNG